MATPTNEHVEALAAAMSARPLDHYRHGGEHEPPAVVAMKKRAERVLVAIRTDPAVQDAVLAALVEGGRLVEEAANSPTVTPISFDRVRFIGSEDGCEAIVYAASQILTITRKVRLVEPEWREATS